MSLARYAYALGLAVLFGCQLRPLSAKLDRATASDAAMADSGRTADAAGDRMLADLSGGCPAFETVEQTALPVGSTAIAVDPSGAVHLVHQAIASLLPRYAVRRQGAWQSETISTNSSGQYSSIAVSSSGTVHLVYYDMVRLSLVYSARGPSGDWSAPQVIAGVFNGGHDLLLDAQQTLHLVAVSTKASREIVYLRRDGASWSSPSVLEAQGDLDAPRPAIATGPDRALHVAFNDAAGRLKLRSAPSGAAFEAPQVLDTNTGRNVATDLAVDGQGQIHLVYHHGTSREQRYVGQSGTQFATPHTVATLSTSALSHNAIGVSSTGDLWITYHNVQQSSRIEVVRRVAGVWKKAEGIDGVTGLSAWLEPSGELHVGHLLPSKLLVRWARFCR